MMYGLNLFEGAKWITDDTEIARKVKTRAGTSVPAAVKALSRAIDRGRETGANAPTKPWHLRLRTGGASE